MLYREMAAGDVADGHALSRASGWNQRADDWTLLLGSNPGRFVAAVAPEGRIVGTAGAACYDGDLAWVCMVLVDAGARGQGIGTRLMEEVLGRVGDMAVVGLDATPLGRPVYEKLGFSEASTFVRMGIEWDATHAEAGSTRTVRQEDLDAILALDREVFGADRAHVLRWASAQTGGRWTGDTRPAGYCFGRLGQHSRHVGPIVANDVETGRAVLTSALRGVTGRVIVDASAEVPGWIPALEAMGFREQRPLYRMYRHGARPPGDPKRQLAILGPEFG